MLNIKPFYTGDVYKTKKSLVPTRFLNNFRFYLNIADITLKASSLSKKGKYTDRAFYNSSYETIRSCEHIGINIDITGLDNIRKHDGPCVFISNHMSVLETYALPSMIIPYKPVTFIVKKSLMEYPVFGNILHVINPIVVDRENPRKDLQTVLTDGTKLLKSGVSIVAFPQSTRTRTVTAEKFNSIGIKLALRAGVPVVPIALKTDAWGGGRFLKDFGPIDVTKRAYFAFGSPMTVKDRGVENHKEVVSFIIRKLDEWENV